MACVSAKSVFTIIDRTSNIDPMINAERKCNFQVNGNIEYKNVSFSYPSRRNIKVKSYLLSFYRDFKLNLLIQCLDSTKIQLES